MYLELDGKGPHHAQLTRALRAAIVEGRLKPGARLPSTRGLCKELGFSRTTVLAAYDQLRAEGFIQGRVGSGSYVSMAMERHPQHPEPPPQLSPPTRYVQRLRAGQLHRAVIPRRAGLRYDLKYGAPLINPALTTAWGRELARAARYTAPDYPDPQGLPALREVVCEYLARRRGVRVEPERVVIVGGTQEALNLTARVLLEEGDAVVLEDPFYHAAFQVFSAHGARLCPVRTDEEGLVCGELPVRPPRVVFVTPSHQFPGGAVMSLPRRLELLRYAQRHDCWVVEDDYDSEFRYNVQPLAALRGLDRNDRVIYVGTFSKPMLGSLRLGYMVVPAALRDDFVRAKWLDNMGCSAIEQAAMASFMRGGGFERHLQRALKVLRARRAAILHGLRRYAGTRIEISDSQAGSRLVVWLRGFDDAQCEQLIREASAQGLGLLPIAPYYFVPPPCPGLLLGYAELSGTELEAAMALLGRCLDAVKAGGRG